MTPTMLRHLRPTDARFACLKVQIEGGINDNNRDVSPYLMRPRISERQAKRVADLLNRRPT